uniref:Uncharacterized protein n=1 Tax=Myotis myotis TaxID=51298 RepID=A0A7J7UCV0_MYOMY|nr:hypothetical protein mMyoMyo1_008801 [Myotis myotis]
MGGDPWGVQPCVVFGLRSEPCPGRLGSSLPFFQEQAALGRPHGPPSKPPPPALRSFVFLSLEVLSRLSPPTSLQPLHRQRGPAERLRGQPRSARPKTPPPGGPHPLARDPSSPQAFEQHRRGAHMCPGLPNLVSPPPRAQVQAPSSPL